MNIARRRYGAWKRSSGSFRSFLFACAWRRTRRSSISSWPSVAPAALPHRGKALTHHRRRTEVFRFENRLRRTEPKWAPAGSFRGLKPSGLCRSRRDLRQLAEAAMRYRASLIQPAPPTGIPTQTKKQAVGRVFRFHDRTSKKINEFRSRPSVEPAAFEHANELEPWYRALRAVFVRMRLSR
jgi:hypothetical protein